MVTFLGGNGLGISELEGTRNPIILHPTPLPSGTHTHVSLSLSVFHFRLGFCLWADSTKIRPHLVTPLTHSTVSPEPAVHRPAFLHPTEPGWSIPLSLQLQANASFLRTFSLFLLPSTVHLEKLEDLLAGEESWKIADFETSAPTEEKTKPGS